MSVSDDPKYPLRMCAKDDDEASSSSSSSTTSTSTTEAGAHREDEYGSQQQGQGEEGEPLTQSGGDIGGHQNPVFKVWRRPWSEVSGHLELSSKTERVEEIAVYEDGDVRDMATTNTSQSTSMSSCFRVEFSQGADIWIQKDLFGDSY